eukprot:scaffold3998_cov153-Skeletonema_dohrnii-CCMP3373.AAC.28
MKGGLLRRSLLFSFRGTKKVDSKWQQKQQVTYSPDSRPSDNIKCWMATIVDELRRRRRRRQNITFIDHRRIWMGGTSCC